MAYTPGYKKSGFGQTGIATISVKTEKGQAGVKFEGQDNWNVVNLKDCPEEVRSYIRPGKFNVKMNEEKSKIYSLSPISGLFAGKIVDFAHQKDKDPATMTKIGAKDDQNWSYLYWIAIVQITKGECAGMQIPLFLRYNFAEGEEEVKGKKRKVVIYSKDPTKSKHTAFLIDVLETVGAWGAGAMPYSDNVLPALLKRIRRAEREFQFIVKKGYIETLYNQEVFPTETDPVADDFDGDDLTDDPVES